MAAEPGPGRGVAVAVAVALGGWLGGRRRFQHPSVGVPRHHRVGLVHLEVGAGRVEEQQVHLEVEQIRHRPVHPLGQLGLHLQQPVHRPVAGVLVDFGQPVDEHPLVHPTGRGQLRRGRQRPVGHQREQHPLGLRVPTLAGQQPRQQPVHADPVPQPVQRVGAAVGAGLHEGQLHRRGRGQRLRRVQHPGQRDDQPADRVAVQPVLAAEVVEHPGPRPHRRVPLVVRQLQVPHHRPVRVPARRRPQVHGPDLSAVRPVRTGETRHRVCLGVAGLQTPRQGCRNPLTCTPTPAVCPDPTRSCGTRDIGSGGLMSGVGGGPFRVARRRRTGGVGWAVEPAHGFLDTSDRTPSLRAQARCSWLDISTPEWLA